MFRTIPCLVALGATLASASPVSVRETQKQPGTSTSNGIILVANVTDPNHDLSPSVQDMVLQGFQNGLGEGSAILDIPGDNRARLFYVNKTDMGLVSVDGPNNSPYGLNVDSPPEATRPWLPYDEQPVSLDEGTESDVFMPLDIMEFEDPEKVEGSMYVVNGVGAGTFIACNRTIPYLNQYRVIVQYAYSQFKAIPGSDNDTASEDVASVPSDCAAIDLVPQCATLPGAPVNGQPIQQVARPVPCYKDVTAMRRRK